MTVVVATRVCARGVVTHSLRKLEDGPRGTVGRVHCFCFVMLQEEREMGWEMRVDRQIAEWRLRRRKSGIVAVDGESEFLAVGSVEGKSRGKL